MQTKQTMQTFKPWKSSCTALWP